MQIKIEVSEKILQSIGEPNIFLQKLYGFIPVRLEPNRIESGSKVMVFNRHFSTIGFVIDERGDHLPNQSFTWFEEFELVSGIHYHVIEIDSDNRYYYSEIILFDSKILNMFVRLTEKLRVKKLKSIL